MIKITFNIYILSCFCRGGRTLVANDNLKRGTCFKTEVLEVRAQRRSKRIKVKAGIAF